MKTKSIIWSSISSSLSIALLLSVTYAQVPVPPPPLSAQNARGIVYWDKNNNGLFDKTEPGIKNVAVSNGKEIVLTDKAGRYNIPAAEDCVVFVIKPAFWKSPADKDSFPRFYYINKPNGSSPDLKYKGILPTGPLPKEINFALYPNQEGNKDKMLLLGDIQTINLKQIEYFGEFFIPELQSSDAAFICTLGDNVDEYLDLYPPLKDTLSLAGKPVFFLPGNNDLDFDVPQDKDSNETYKSFFGPSYYSFNWGQWHLLMLDDVNYKGAGKGYGPGLGKTQMDFILNDLKMLPSSQKLILMMHIPIKDLPKEEKEILFNELSRFHNIFSVAGHYHSQENLFLGKEDGWKGEKPLHLLIQGTACGCTWNGLPDEFGIPHASMYDGTPKGYSIVELSDGYQVFYKIPNRPADYQMNIYAPVSVSAPELATTDIKVNVFTGSDRTKVEMRIDGQTLSVPMEKTLGQDSEFIKQWQFEQKLAPQYFDRNGWFPNCTHLWKAKLPANLSPGAHLIEIDANTGRNHFQDKTVIWVK